MKFPLSWLKDHLETEASLAEICDGLTRIGLEVEHVEDPAERLKGFVVAEIREAVQHPNADRLRVCQVDVGAGALVQVVCGAPNARAGLRTVFSPPGTYIPGKDITIEKGSIRGVESAGMMCSAAELELSEEHDGILELAGEARPGEAYAAVAGLDDPVIEINLTPNRPDAAGVSGVARDLAAAGLGKLKTRAPEPVAGAFDCPVAVQLDFSREDAHLAPLFALRLVRGVKNGPSPEWMQRRLRAIGLRPINALVDITNYVTFDRGRPLHVFDAGKVEGGLVVRRAQAGEEILALDGKTYRLGPDMVVIADGRGVESIAGVMGGEHSGCDEATTDVLIESALWDPINIARTGRALGVATDARYRFERGVDPQFCLPGAELATRLTLELCGGEASSLVVAGHAPPERPNVIFAWSEVARLTGMELAPQEMAAILERLGFVVAGTAGNSDRAIVHIPSWRPDVEGQADLVEEITRIAGLERVESTPLPRAPGVAAPVLTGLQKRIGAARRLLAARGLMEAVTYSFVSRAQAAAFGGGAPELALSNPIAADLSDMRPSLAPGLLAALQRNFQRGMADVALFEAGQVFRGAGENDQGWAACAARRGGAHMEGAGRNWAGALKPVGAFDARADALGLLAGLGVAPGAVQIVAGGPDFLHPGRSARLQFGPKQVVGWFGELHPRVLEALGIDGPVAAMEIALDKLPAPKAKATRAKPKLELSALMPVERDFAFLVDHAVAAADLVRAVAGADKALIADVGVFDVYEGAGVPEGQKSLALSVTLQPRAKTLTEADLDAVAQRIVAEAQKKTGAVLRG